MNTINRCSIRFHRARALGGKPRTLAIIHSQQGNLVHWRRIVLPVGMEAIQATQQVMSGFLRQLGKNGNLPVCKVNSDDAARKELQLSELESGQKVIAGPDKPRGGC